MSFRAGFVGLIGQPNAGKSTLLNFLVKEKVSIVSAKPQTTRRRMLGILNDDRGQVVFVDAPGLLSTGKGLNAYLEREAREVIGASDALIAVLSVDEESVEAATKTVALIKESGKPWFGVVTKTDIGDKHHRILILKSIIEQAGGKALRISAAKPDRDTAEDRASLIDECINLLPESPAPLYDIELFTPESERTLVAEIVREKCFANLHQEIPFSLAIRIILFDEDAIPVMRIAAEILVAKDNHKGIVIGKGGQLLKKIGTEARIEIEKLLGQKIFLELKVSVRENWSDNNRIMKELGYVHDDQG